MGFQDFHDSLMDFYVFHCLFGYLIDFFDFHDFLDSHMNFIGFHTFNSVQMGFFFVIIVWISNIL